MILKLTTFSVWFNQIWYRLLISWPLKSTKFICEIAHMILKCSRSANRFHSSKEVFHAAEQAMPTQYPRNFDRETSPWPDKNIYSAPLPSALMMLKISEMMNSNPTRGNCRIILKIPELFIHWCRCSSLVKKPCYTNGIGKLFFLWSPIMPKLWFFVTFDPLL